MRSVDVDEGDRTDFLILLACIACTIPGLPMAILVMLALAGKAADLDPLPLVPVTALLMATPVAACVLMQLQSRLNWNLAFVAALLLMAGMTVLAGFLTLVSLFGIALAALGQSSSGMVAMGLSAAVLFVDAIYSLVLFITFIIVGFSHLRAQRSVRHAV
jgi:hypothetical protein